MSVFCRDSTWREVRLELAGVTPAAAPQPCSPATLQRVSGGGAGYCSGGGGAEVGAGLRHLSDPHFLSSRTLPNPAPLVGLPPSVEGDRAGPWGSITGGGGARRAGPGQVHTAVLCSGMGGAWGLPKDPDWLPWRSGGTWSGVEEAALVVRPGPSCAESATAAAVPAGWGQGRKGCSPSPGTWGARGWGDGVEGGVPRPAPRARPGTSSSRLLLLFPSTPEGGAGGREGDSPSCPAHPHPPFLQRCKLLPSPAGMAWVVTGLRGLAKDPCKSVWKEERP